MKTNALSDVHMQIMWNRLISVVEEQAVTLIRTAFSTSVRESGDLSAGVFNRGGKMLAQAVTGTPGHVNAMAEAVGHFIRDIRPGKHLRGRRLHHQRPMEGHRPPARLHRRLAELPQRFAGRLLRLHGACGGCRRPRFRPGCQRGLRGRHLRPDHEVCRARQGQQAISCNIVRNNVRESRPGGRRRLFARSLQRDRPSPPDRHDGRVRSRGSGNAGRLHLQAQLRRDVRADCGSANGLLFAT